MDLLSKIDVSLISLKDQENYIFDFDKETLSKMRLLGYPDDEIVDISEKKEFSEICKIREKIFIEPDFSSGMKTFEALADLREKVLYDFYKKFRYSYKIEDESLRKMRYAEYKV